MFKWKRRTTLGCTNGSLLQEITGTRPATLPSMGLLTIVRTGTLTMAETSITLVLNIQVVQCIQLVTMPTHFNKTVSAILFQIKNSLTQYKTLQKFCHSVIATQELYPEVVTESSITVSYFPDPGVDGSQMVVRSSRLGRFVGECDPNSGSCSVSNLKAGFTYFVWVRTCSGSGPTHCILRALPTEISTFPTREH